MSKINKILKYAILLIIGGIAYCGIEMLWRGHTHWTMFIMGGVCFIFCGSINELFDIDMPIWIQMLICAAGITAIEFVAGIILNVILQLNVWDYSNMPFNVLGQICLPFSFLWFLLSFAAIWLDDWLRYWLFNEEKPHYRFW